MSNREIVNELWSEIDDYDYQIWILQQRKVEYWEEYRAREAELDRQIKKYTKSRKKTMKQIIELLKEQY